MSKRAGQQRRKATQPPSEKAVAGTPRAIVLAVLAGGVVLLFVMLMLSPMLFDDGTNEPIDNAATPDTDPSAIPATSTENGKPPAEGDHASTAQPPSSPPPKQTDTLLDSTEPLSSKEHWRDIDDPTKDGWDTEAFNDAAGKQLKKLGKLLSHPDEITPDAVADLAASDFSCDALLPTPLERVYEDHVLAVDRADLDTQATADQQAGAHRGDAGLAAALRELAEPLRGAEDIRFKFKIIRVLPATDRITTHQYFSLSGTTSHGAREQNATWIIRWQAAKTPRLQWIGVTDFEQVAAADTDGPLFADCTEWALAANESYHRQILLGHNHWLQRIENTRDMALFGAPGIAVGDVNGDGLEDLYLCQEQGLPNRLFVQAGDGTLRDESEAAGVDWLHDCRSALLVDLDNDADQDLVVSTIGNLVVAANDGQGRFSIRTLLPTSDDTMSISASDYDLDGKLDLYVCGYNPDRTLDKTGAAVFASSAETFVFHDANNGAPNRLFRNEIPAPDQPWQFADVTDEVGLDEHNRRYSFACAWEDYDNDGDPDLYVANDYGRDNLYRNDRTADGEPRFVDVSNIAHAEDSAGGMSVAWGDYDRDGWMDAYVSNMFSSAGNRVTYQPTFQQDAPSDVKQRLQQFARGNTLLNNRSDGTFEDVSQRASVEMGRWAWGSLFADLNNDGWEDLFVANGYMTADDTGDL